MDVITLALAKKYADEKLTNIDSLSTQSDWNQNDENAVDYIKNRPFGVEGMEEFALGENVQHKSKLMPGTFFSEISHTFDPNLQYKIIINEDEYICTPQMNDKGNWYLGSTRNTLDLFPNILDMDPSKYNWDNEEYPFSYGSGGFVIKPPYQDTYTISLYQIREKIKTLDAKYINYIPGQKTAFKTVVYDDTEYICEEGAEIFNDYLSNLAIGQYSHAEGNKTTAIGDYSHAEGYETIADGKSAHAEGDGAKASGYYSHAEGGDTEAIGTGSHTEGIGTKANANSSHAEGEYTIALGQSQHVQGKYNIEDTPPKYIPTYASYLTPEAVPEVDGDEIVYLIKEEDITFDGENNYYIIKDFTETPYKDLKEGDNYLTTKPTSNNVSLIYHIRNLVSSRVDESTGKTYYKWLYGLKISSPNSLGMNCKYAHIVGNGSREKRSNAHTLDWNGNAWYQGDVYVGSNSGVIRDEGSKKLATEDFVSEKFNQLSQEKASKATTLAGYGITDGVTNEQIEQFSGTVEITSDAPTKEKTVLTIDPSADEINIYSVEEVDVMVDTLTDKSDDMQRQIKVERARIDQFTSLEEGSTTGDAELEDARIDYEGNTHANVGDHIRSVSNQLSNEIDGVKEDLGEFRNEIFTTKTQTITSPNIFNIADNNTTSNGITATLKNNKITLSGTYDKDYNSTFKIGEITLGAGTYTITGWSDAPTTLARLHFVNGSDIKEILFDNATTNCRLTITEPTTLTVKVRCYPGFVGNGMIMKPMIVKGQIVPTEYEEYFKPYEQVIVGDLSVEFAEKINTHTNSKNILYGKKWAVCGDSFSNGDWTGSDEAHTITNGKYIGKNATYGYLIGNRNDMNIQHMAFGGRTIATPQNLSSHNCFSDTESPQNYTKIDSDVDYITLYFGINDSHNAPTSDGSDGEILVGEIPLGTINDTTVNTFYGAWNVILPYLIKNYPFAKIGILVSNGCDTDEYRQATIKVAKKHGIPYIDLNGDDRTPCMNRSTNENILSSVRISRTKAFRVSETNGHPNAKAHEYESYFIENFLRSL